MLFQTRERSITPIEVQNERHDSLSVLRHVIRTFTLWCKKGREADDGIYHDFWLAVLEAEKAAEVNCVRIVMKAAEADAKHAQWWLERKFPKKWGRKDRREINKTVEHTHEIRTDLPLSECIAIYQKAIEAKKVEGGQEPAQNGGTP